MIDNELIRHTCRYLTLMVLSRTLLNIYKVLSLIVIPVLIEKFEWFRPAKLCIWPTVRAVKETRTREMFRKEYVRNRTRTLLSKQIFLDGSPRTFTVCSVQTHNGANDKEVTRIDASSKATAVVRFVQTKYVDSVLFGP